MVRRQTASRPASARPASRSEASSLKMGRGGHDRSKELDPRSPTYREQLSKRLGVDPDKIKLQVQKSSDGVATGVKVKVVGLTKDAAAEVEAKAKRAASTGMGLPIPETMRAKSRGFVSGVRATVKDAGSRVEARSGRATNGSWRGTTLSGPRGATKKKRSDFGSSPTRKAEKAQQQQLGGAMEEGYEDDMDETALARIRRMVTGALDREYGILTRRQNLVRAFRVLDGSHSNNVSRAELDRGVTRMGLWLPLGARQQLFAALDADRDGLVNVEDLRRFLFEDGKKKNTSAEEGVAGGGGARRAEDLAALSEAMKRRRVLGETGQALQRRFRDYAFGDALLYALHGILPDDYSGDVSLQREEFEAILLKARVPISRAELRWVCRTFAVQQTGGNNGGGHGGRSSGGFRLHRLEAAPLINFALGMSDPWVETGSLEEILASITPEEIERMEDRQVRQGGGTYGAYARPPSSAAPSSSSRTRARAAANGYDDDDDDDDDDGYDDIKGGKFEGYRGSKVVPPGRRPGRNDDYPQPRRRRHDDRGEEEGWGAAATVEEEEREEEEASAFYDPRLAFARPLFGGGPSSDRRRQQGPEWRDFKNPGGYTARGDEGVDMRRREVHHHQPVHASRGGGDYDDYYDEASAYGSGRGRQQQQQQSGSRGGDGWGPYPNLDEAFRFDEDENDGGGGGGGGGRSYSGAYGDVGGGKEAAARFGYGSAFGGRGGRQRRKRTVRFGTSSGREGEEEVEKAAGRNDDFYGDNDIDDDFGAGRDYHELSAAVAFMDGEEAKQAKMLEKAMARRMVEKGGGYEDGYQGSEEAKHRHHPVVSRMLHEDAAEAARLKDVDQEAADIAAAKAQIEGSDRGGFGSYGVGRNEKYGGGGLDAAIEESGRTRDLRPKPRPAEGVEAVPFPRQDDDGGQPNRHLVKCLVTCPASLYPGDEFDVRLRGVGYTVAVPQGVKPGRQFAVHLDTRKEGGAVSGATPRGDDEKDDDDDDDDDGGAARRRRGGGGRSSRRGLWAVDEIGAAPGVGPGSSNKASSSLDERAEAAYQEEKRMREEARKRIASEAAAEAGAGAGGRNGRGGGGDSQWEDGANQSFGPTERANSGRQREQWWRPPSSSSGSRFYRGRPLSQAPFSTFPRGRTNRASIARARAAAEGAGDYGGDDDDDDEDDEYYYGTKSRSKYGNAEKKENRGAVGKNASVAAAGGGGSLRSRLGVATWEWEEEILREGGGGRGGGPRRPDRSRGPPPPLEGERAQQRNVDSTAYPVLGGARPLFGPPATNQGGGARSRSVRSAAVDCLNDGGSWLGGGRRMESKEDIQRNERKFERLMAKRVGSRVSALEEMDPEEYKTLGLPKAGTRRGFDEEDGEGGDFGDGLDVDDPYLQPDYEDHRPLRGNNVDPATGRYPPLPGRWRARVGAAQFGRKPKVRHLSGQVKAAYRALCKGTEAPAVNVRAFFDFWDRDQDGLLGLEDLILLSMETSVSGESPQRRKGGPSSRQPWCNMSIEDRAGLENLPPELRTVDEFVQSVKEAAGRSLGSQPGGLTLGELERWLEPPDPTMAALRRKVAAQLERTLARDLGAGFVAGGRASAGEAAANLLRGAMRRVTVEVQEDTYDGAVPIQVVSQPALIKAVRRAELPLSMAEIGLLAETFRARKPEGGSGAAIRDLDYDGIVRFLTT